jgi:ABC-type polysaccharide/polyol phosphate export permease
LQWALVLAGISDFARPAEKLSFTQNLALTCTGIIWTRWCLIIKPKNYLYAYNPLNHTNSS